MSKIIFNPNEKGGLELARAIVLERLRNDKSWQQYDHSGEGFDRYVEYIGDQGAGRRRLVFLAQDVLWEFMIQGIIAPGLNVSNPNLPWFHITEYGEKVLVEKELLPHDPAGYLEWLRSEIPSCDSTVLKYLSESLNCFTRGCLIASVVMLGVASERAFLILCDAFLNAINNSAEKSKFQKILDQVAIKPKMDWVLNKIQIIQSKPRRPLPDNVNVMLAAIFDFIRCQRNELGHPQESPPKITRDDAYVNLRIFPNYYKMVTQVIDYLRQNKI
jgi:hypothetical protein